MDVAQPQETRTITGCPAKEPHDGGTSAGSRILPFLNRIFTRESAGPAAFRAALRSAPRAAAHGLLHFDGTRLAWRLRAAAARLRLSLRRRSSMRPVVLAAVAAVLSWGIMLGAVNVGEAETKAGRYNAAGTAFLVEASPANGSGGTDGDENAETVSASSAAQTAASSAHAAPRGRASSSAASAAGPRSAAAKPAAQAAAASSRQAAVKAVPALLGNYVGDPFADPQCVWYVWGRVKAVTGLSLEFNTDSGRSANQWLSQVVENSRVHVVRDPNAVRADSIAVFSHGGEGNGHALFVEQVTHTGDGTPGQVVFSESNWGSSKAPVQKMLSWSAFRERSRGSLMGYIYVD